MLALLASGAVLALVAASLARAAPGIATLVVLMGFAVAGYCLGSVRSRIEGAPSTDAEWLIEGSVEEGPLVRGDRQSQIVVVDRVSGPAWKPARFRARLSSEVVPLVVGDRFRARARLSPPPRDLNPGAPGCEARWRAEGLGAMGAVVERQLAILGPASPFAHAAAQFRARYSEVARDALPDPMARALVRALVVGDRTDLSPEVNDDFSASGLAHILSVSGLHIAVVAAGLYRALRWLLARSEQILLTTNVRALAALSAVPATWLYVWVTGSEVPAVRSGIMASAIFLATAVGRDSDVASSLAAALLAVLAWDPAALWSISFQLSFGAVAGLMLLTRPIRSLLPFPEPDRAATGLRAKLTRWGEAVLGTAVGSLASSLATAPLVAAAFHRASLVAVLSNAVALPVASGLTVLAAVSAALLPVGATPSAFVLCLADPLARCLLFLSHLFGSLPFASALVPAPSAGFLVAWYAGLAALAMVPLRRRAAVRLGALCTVALVALGVSRLVSPLLRRTLVVTFLAAGQGDSAIVQAPGGDDLLIDGGGDPAGHFDPGERVVVPALADLGATRLRAAVVSHPHPDHILGVLSALQRVNAREIWVGRGLDASDPLVVRLHELARSRGIPVRELTAGDRIRLGDAWLEVLAPSSEAQTLGANDASLVLRLRFGATSFLFPGDIEKPGEENLLGRCDPSSTLLKVPHHGSRTSSTPSFVERVHPQHVVIPVGRNRFGFPHEEVVARYRQIGAAIHRTDLEGAITAWSDGASLHVEPFLGETIVQPGSGP